VAESKDLSGWRKIGEVQPEGEVERRGICAPGLRRLGGRLHMFYQTYGGGPKDSICHATSDDGLKWRRNPTNPVFRVSGDWNCGRVIDAEVIEHNGSLLMLGATRDPAYKTQMLVAARAPLDSDFGRASWKQAADYSVLKPELPWEKSCIEAPSMIRRDGRLWCFYAGGYNNEPQQVGVAVSDDGVRWTRHSDKPFLPNGSPGDWNASESGHPCIFEDDDQRTYLFFQGNNDKGRTWYLSWVEVGWNRTGPFLVG
jgi:beta-1,2-mannobiose phosphorylase / 1,2-beta-oligomannan phosphorylase